MLFVFYAGFYFFLSNCDEVEGIKLCIERKIKNFTTAVLNALETKNWYAALSISFTLPDICSKTENPNKSTSVRYPDWFGKYVSKYYSFSDVDSTSYTYLNGNDAYALRCSFLHQGETNIENQKARRVLNDYVFVAPVGQSLIHNNKVNDTLQLQVDIFCKDIIKGVEEWLGEVKNNTKIKETSKNIIEIKTEFPFGI